MTSTTSSTEDYNGWTNRETWAAALHLSNDYNLDKHTRDRARTAYVCATVPYGLGPEYLRAAQRGAIADALESIADTLRGIALGEIDPRGRFPRDVARGFVIDVGSIWRVEWREIAEHYRADIEAEQVAA